MNAARLYLKAARKNGTRIDTDEHGNAALMDISPYVLGRASIRLKWKFDVGVVIDIHFGRGHC